MQCLAFPTQHAFKRHNFVKQFLMSNSGWRSGIRKAFRYSVSNDDGKLAVGNQNSDQNLINIRVTAPIIASDQATLFFLFLVAGDHV